MPYEAGDTNWSSDGKKIAFERDIDGMKQSDPNAYAEVWTMNPGRQWRNRHRNECSGVGCAPRFNRGLPWFRTRKSLSTPVQPAALPFINFATMNLDGSNRHQLTSDGKNKFLPHFSPDGTQLLYTKFLAGAYAQPGAHTDLALFDFASAKETLLTCTGQERQPVWSPDGKRITWLSASSP